MKFFVVHHKLSCLSNKYAQNKGFSLSNNYARKQNLGLSLSNNYAHKQNIGPNASNNYA